ncbi:MAG TPA: hypothetical protein VGW39_06325 [Chthoniobacterales bacterium]|nr:hypothetical protein [Chthoniobacterales bacterium]
MNRFLITLFIASFVITIQTFAQDNLEFQYAAKFVCGRTDAASGLAAPGQYYTIVNVHNPSPNTTVEFRKKFARALPGEKAGKITQFFPAALRADEAMAMECANIYEHTGIAPGTFIDGYAVIHSPKELDVVAVYTAGAPNVATLHTERVLPRRVPVVPVPCATLDLGLNTGTAKWQIIADPDSATAEPRAASVIASPHPLWGTLAGAKWIGPATTAGGFNPVPLAGDYVYQFCFCLCSGFTNAKLTFTGLADDRANVTLNGNPINTNNPTIPGFSGTGTQVQTSNQQLFKAGTNCVKITVKNDGGPTGLILAGSVTATAGLCPQGPTDASETADPVNPQ